MFCKLVYSYLNLYYTNNLKKYIARYYSTNINHVFSMFFPQSYKNYDYLVRFRAYKLLNSDQII